MKYTGILFIASLSLLWSCTKNGASFVEPQDGQEVVLALEDNELDATVTTKATAITSVPSNLYWAATTGTSGSSETKKYDCSYYSVNAEKKIHTGKYQTATPTVYNWYVSNQAINVPASSGAATLTIADNSIDVIAGVHKSTNSIYPAVTMKHVFARTGTLTLNTQKFSETKNYLLDNVSWKIQSKAGSTGGTAGTYNIGTNTYSGVTALGLTTLGTKMAASSNDNVCVHSSDLYCFPGIYTVTVSYRLRLRNDDGTIDYSKEFSKSADITLQAGRINTITATAVSGNAQEIIITCTLEDWGTNPISMTLPDDSPLPGLFTVNSSGKMVQFSRGNLYWDGSKYAFEAHQYDYPTTRNTDHIGYFFYSKNAAIARAASYSDPSATGTDVLFAANGGAVDGYTVLSEEEWLYLIDHNMQSKATVTIAGINCSVLVPDGYAGSVASSYTAETWKTAEAQGLVAIPYAGYFYNGSDRNAGSFAFCWSCSPYAGLPGYAWFAYFTSGGAGTDNDLGRRYGFSVRLVKVVDEGITGFSITEDVKVDHNYDWSWGDE